MEPRMKSLIIIPIFFTILTITNLLLALNGNIYPKDDTWGTFALYEAIMLFSSGLAIAGLYLVLFISYTSFNLFLFLAIEEYHWLSFTIIQIIAFIWLAIWLSTKHKGRSQDKNLQDTDEQTIDTISNSAQSEYNQTPFTVSYNIKHSAHATPSEAETSTYEIKNTVSFGDISFSISGNGVEIRHPFGDPKQTEKKGLPVTCPYCQTHFDLSNSSVCPNCGAPYAK